MVGVPGRSKACHNCRQRRMACDSKRPGCDNCSKSGRLCAGYQRNHAFILSKDVITSNQEVYMKVGADAGVVLLSRWRVDHSRPSSVAKPSTMVFPPHILPSRNSMPTELSPHNLFRDKLLGTYLEYHQLPAIANPPPGIEERRWIREVVDLPTRMPALEHAVLAICTAKLGRVHNHPELVHKSLSLYNRSLRELRRALHDPATRKDEQTFAASSVLCLYEIFECPGQNIRGYLSHYDGMMELMRLRGADAHKSGLSHALFLGIRIHAMLQSFNLRSTTFLTEPAWQKLPWLSRKTHFDLLLDILLEMPVLLAQDTIIEKSTSLQDQFRGGLESIQKGQQMESKLTGWLAGFETSTPGPLYRPELSQLRSATDDIELGKVFPVAFQFPSFAVARNILYYWIGLITVHAHIDFAYKTLDRLVAIRSSPRQLLPCTCTNTYGTATGGNPMTCPQHFEMSFLPPIGHRANWPTTTAYNICQSVEYFVHGEWSELGAVSVLPPLAVVKAYWENVDGDWRREIGWVNDMLSRIKEHGLEIANVF